ncbi:mechanosensitive ion channel family protein [Sphingomicrobium lutaoense]|uniref:Small-conductance mechanosensitive channel n=1 Tax=Sphingomicrobium lutaoense TaxID=515949 RepID=A0A839Z447_9SPHN|nr:mechanosensitive ion channel family protein [Sphingomicrobium lutaoense]MBB3763384.1 small-conductance mechanosensitive channel [Sphingomicrobium lutaoense]
MTSPTEQLANEAIESISEDAEAVEQTVASMEQPVQDTIGWFGDNWDGLLLGGLVALGLVGIMLILRAIGRGVLHRDPERTSWKAIIAGVLAKTTITFMVVTAAHIVAAHTDISEDVEEIFHVAFIIVLAIQAAIWARELILGVVVSKVVDDGDRESTLANALSLIRVLVNITAFAIAFIVILDNLGVNVTTLVAGLGIGGIAIGLAAQGIFSDLFAALAIVFDRPFRKGDTIRYGTTTGTVEKIGLKTTRLRAVTGEQVIMANTKLLDQEVNNIAEAHSRRITIPFGVIYQTDPKVLAQMKAIVTEAVEPYEDIDIVRIVCTGFGDSSIDFELVYDHHSEDWNEIVGIKSQICIRILEIFNGKGIEFAYPTQTTFTSAPDGTMIMPYPENGFPVAPPPTEKS